MTAAKKNTHGGARPGTGPKKGKPHKGQFKQGHSAINYSKNKPIREALIQICELAPGSSFVPKNNWEVLALRIWEYAQTVSPSNPSGFRAIETVWERIEGKTVPSAEELKATTESKTVTVVLPRIIDESTKAV